jgi:hypothetical protein
MPPKEGGCLRLCNQSWFMKCLNEPVVHKANKEENCTGHVWGISPDNGKLNQINPLHRISLMGLRRSLEHLAFWHHCHQ